MTVLHGCLPRGGQFAGALFGSADVMDFLSIHNGLPGRGDAKAHSVTSNGNDGDSNLIVDDDLLPCFARKH
jgi:hypothetical protein